MMKRNNIVILMMLTLLITLLSGCQLAKENTVYLDDGTIINSDNDDINKMPYAITFDLYTDERLKLNTDDYFHYTWDCNRGEENIICNDRAKSISGFTKFNSAIIDDEQGIRNDSTTMIFDGYMYVSSKFLGGTICPVIRYLDESKNEEAICMELLPGAGIRIKQTSVDSSGEELIIDFNIEFIAVDELQNVEIMEFNNDDELVNTTLITETFDQSEFSTSNETTYIIITENYIDEKGVSYSERTLFNKDEYSPYEHFELKFTDQNGFIVIAPLVISFN